MVSIIWQGQFYQYFIFQLYYILTFLYLDCLPYFRFLLLCEIAGWLNMYSPGKEKMTDTFFIDNMTTAIYLPWSN